MHSRRQLVILLSVAALVGSIPLLLLWLNPSERAEPDLAPPLFELDQQQGLVVCLAFSPDGSMLATGDTERAIKIWDMRTGEKVVVLTGHERDVSTLMFSPDGKVLASGSWDSSVRLWETNSWQLRAEQMAHRGGTRVLAFSSDGKVLFTCGNDGMITLWDGRTLQRKSAFRVGNKDIDQCRFHPNGEIVATIEALQWGKDWIKLWDLSTGQLVGLLGGDLKPTHALAFAPKSNILVSASSDGTVSVWNWERKSLLKRIDAQDGGIFSIAFSGDGRYAAFGGIKSVKHPGYVELWNAQTWEKISEVAAAPTGITVLAFSPQGNLIALANYPNQARVLELQPLLDAGEP